MARPRRFSPLSCRAGGLAPRPFVADQEDRGPGELSQGTPHRLGDGNEDLAPPRAMASEGSGPGDGLTRDRQCQGLRRRKRLALLPTRPRGDHWQGPRASRASLRRPREVGEGLAAAPAGDPRFCRATGRAEHPPCLRAGANETHGLPRGARPRGGRRNPARVERHRGGSRRRRDRLCRSLSGDPVARS